MRTVTKTISLKVGETPMDFRIGKLDAFSGARLLKFLSRAETDDLRDLLFGLPDADRDALMRCCLHAVSALLPAGPVRVLDGDCWGMPELEFDAFLCLRLTLEVIAWTLEGFFQESGSPS